MATLTFTEWGNPLSVQPKPPGQPRTSFGYQPTRQPPPVIRQVEVDSESWYVLYVSRQGRRCAAPNRKQSRATADKGLKQITAEYNGQRISREIPVVTKLQ